MTQNHDDSQKTLNKSTQAAQNNQIPDDKCSPKSKPSILLQRKDSLISLTSRNPLSQSQIQPKDEDLSKHLNLIKSRNKFVENSLYIKGLNNDYKIFYEVDKIEKNLERKLANPHLKINKDIILNSLKKSAFNSTYLKNQQKQKADLDKNLQQMGINLEVFKSVAMRMMHQKQYEAIYHKDRKKNDSSISSKIEDDSMGQTDLQNLLSPKRRMFQSNNQQLLQIYKGKRLRKFAENLHQSFDQTMENQSGYNTMRKSILNYDAETLDQLEVNLQQRLQIQNTSPRSINGINSLNNQGRKKTLKLSEEQEIQNESNYINKLLLRTSDNFLQKKIQNYHKQRNIQ
eukprot:403339896